MPEQLTKHPEVTLQVLRSTGAQCGQGAVQEILTQCPAERFCKLPGGEVCVYGLPQASQMTQITVADWKLLLPPADGAAAPADLGLGGLGLLAGLLIGWGASRWRSSSRTR